MTSSRGCAVACDGPPKRSDWRVDIRVSVTGSPDFGPSLAKHNRRVHHALVSGNWRTERLPELVCALAGRPRHEALRGHITELLRSGFDAPYAEIDHEVYLLDRTGRIDTMWGATIIELRSDLRRELGDVHNRLPDYLRDASKRARSPRPVTVSLRTARCLSRSSYGTTFSKNLPATRQMRIGRTS